VAILHEGDGQEAVVLEFKEPVGVVEWLVPGLREQG
jgi:hypothetical protein